MHTADATDYSLLDQELLQEQKRFAQLPIRVQHQCHEYFSLCRKMLAHTLEPQELPRMAMLAQIAADHDVTPWCFAEEVV